MPAELIAVSEQDEAIFELWQGGAGLRQIARQMRIDRMAVEQALDRVLPVLSQVTQARAYKRHLFFMEDLETEFYAIAKSDKSSLRDRYDAAHLCARLNEGVCAMKGWSSMSIRMDPPATATAQQPSRYEKITAAIERIARRNNGNGPPLELPADDQNCVNSERLSTSSDRER